MTIFGRVLVTLAAGTLVAGSAPAQPVDLDMINRIRAEALERSQVMAIARELTDRIGPRLTGSPAMKRANEWTRDELAGWGLSRARLEPFEFGEGWSCSKVQVRMVAPVAGPLEALPKGWTVGTPGAVRGEAIRVTLAEPEDLEAQKGKLAGRIVLLDGARGESEPETRPGPMRTDDFERWNPERLADLVEFDLREPRGESWRARARKRAGFSKQLAEFLVAEGVVATIELSSRDHGIVRVGGEAANRDPSRPRGVPGLVMAAEPYQRLLRLLEDGAKVELELDVETAFHGDDLVAYSTLAELTGSDRRGELVLAGAHLDSWHAGTGATDNAAGVAVVMEAVRILKAIGAKPRRTIRVALWGGEEQGLLGSRDYVERYVATRPESTDPGELALPRGLREETWPLTPKPEHAKISAYFNLDNGGGRIRGIYTQGNVAVAPIFTSWLAPLADLGATTVTNESTGSTDHVPFDRVGVPAFQFVQDPLDYFGRTHHTDLDTFEYLNREDLVQSSIVMATFLWQTANREELLPRKPFPTEPPRREKPEAAGDRAH
jgi:hypothetical protein